MKGIPPKSPSSLLRDWSSHPAYLMIHKSVVTRHRAGSQLLRFFDWSSTRGGALNRMLLTLKGTAKRLLKIGNKLANCVKAQDVFGFEASFQWCQTQLVILDSQCNIWWNQNGSYATMIRLWLFYSHAFLILLFEKTQLSCSIISRSSDGRLCCILDAWSTIECHNTQWYKCNWMLPFKTSNTVTMKHLISINSDAGYKVHTGKHRKTSKYLVKWGYRTYDAFLLEYTTPLRSLVRNGINLVHNRQSFYQSVDKTLRWYCLLFLLIPFVLTVSPNFTTNQLLLDRCHYSCLRSDEIRCHNRPTTSAFHSSTNCRLL